MILLSSVQTKKTHYFTTISSVSCTI